MTQSTTVVNACDAAVYLDDADGTLRDISGSSNVVRIRYTNEASELARFDADVATRYLLAQDLSVDLTILYSTASNESLDILRNWAITTPDGNDARTFRVEVPDSTTDSHRYSMEVVPVTMDVPLEADEGGPVEVRAELRVTGAYTVGTVTTSTSTSTTSTSTTTSTTSTSTTTSSSTSTTSSSTSTTTTTSSTTSTSTTTTTP